MNSLEKSANFDGPSVLPVSEIVRHARRLLEAGTPLCWVSGEVSNLSRAASGHLYFTLKDEHSQLRCTMWRNRAQLMSFQLSEGMRVDVRAQLTVYEPRGDMQMSIENIRRAGLGNLFEALQQLKQKLAAEGLFDETKRRPLPLLPKSVGIVTSLAGAALQDVLSTLRRRAPGLQILIYPTPVQGSEAAAGIARAIHTASQCAVQDRIAAIILCRGGGSIEDLWAFNDEAVVRAIRAASVPVVSGVGHETDSTLSDFAADLRAATPTAAAEAVSAGLLALQVWLPQSARRLYKAAERSLNSARQRMDLLERSLRHPQQSLAAKRARLAQIRLRLLHVKRAQWQTANDQVRGIQSRLDRYRPPVELAQQRLLSTRKQLKGAMEAASKRHRFRLETLAARLHGLDPSAIMQRGYAIVRDANGAILRDTSRLQTGNRVSIKLAVGVAQAEVIHIDSDDRST